MKFDPMKVRLPAFLRTIRGRLILGFGVLVVLLISAVMYGRVTISEMSQVIARTLHEVREESRLSSQLSATIAREIQVADAYLDTRDPAAQREFRSLSWQAHRIQRELNALPAQTAEEIALVASVDSRLSTLEVHYARAHRLADLGRERDARTAVGFTSVITDSLVADIRRLGEMKAAKVTAATERLASDTRRRAFALVLVIFVALTVGGVFVFTVVQSIARQMKVLVRHAHELSEGNLTVRTSEKMPREFEVLAHALNHTGESLSRIVQVVARTADDVASSAEHLASVSQQISTSAHHMAQAMTEVTSGAESQVVQLRGVDGALGTIRERAEHVRNGAAEVNALAGEIADSASSKRREIDRALAILTDVRETVLSAANEVSVLSSTAEGINKFVTTVSRIAEQTNLLALNAAIEAARAGAAGRGFAVVADEVRKLAEQTQTAADEIVQMTGAVTSRVASTSRAMESGASRVGEIERVSREIDEALSTISSAAERTRVAAESVSQEAGSNEEIVVGAATNIASIARTAEGHAATAQEIGASTEQQSAACEQMNSASAVLMEGSTLLRQLVKGLRTGENGTSPLEGGVRGGELPAPAAGQPAASGSKLSGN